MNSNSFNPNSFKDVEHARQLEAVWNHAAGLSRSAKWAWLIVTAYSFVVGSLGSCAYRRGTQLEKLNHTVCEQRQAAKDDQATITTLRTALLHASGDVVSLRRDLEASRQKLSAERDAANPLQDNCDGS